MRLGDELEIGRLLSFGLVDLHPAAAAAVDLPQPGRPGASCSSAATVVDQVTQVRQAWVRAVAAQQSLQYAEQVSESAEASAELARRMQQVGNFSKLQRARQQVFYADATTQLASARHAATAAREELVRALGLDDAQAAQAEAARAPAGPAQGAARSQRRSAATASAAAPGRAAGPRCSSTSPASRRASTCCRPSSTWSSA